MILYSPSNDYPTICINNRPRSSDRETSKTEHDINGLEKNLASRFILNLKIKRNDWLLADTCPQAANRYALF